MGSIDSIQKHTPERLQLVDLLLPPHHIDGLVMPLCLAYWMSCSAKHEQRQTVWWMLDLCGASSA